MPAFDFDLATASSSNANSVYRRDTQAWGLRKHVAGVFSPLATYDVAGSIVTTPAMALPAVSSLFSLNADVVYPTDEDGVEQGTLTYRLSMNGGATYYYYTGGAWTIASTSAHFNDIDTLQLHLATFPLPTTGTVAPRLQIKILPDSAGLYTPLVYDVSLAVELHQRAFEDAVASVITHLQPTTFKLISSEVLTTTTDTIRFAGVFTKFTVSSILRVYDLTADPGRRVNLYDSYTADPGDITLTAEVTYGHEVEIEYLATCPVSPFAEDTLYTAEIPHLGIVPLVTKRDDEFGNWREIITNKPANASRSRLPPELFVQRFRVYCLAARNEEALQMAEGVTRRIEGVPFVYLPTGEQMTLVQLDHMNNLDFEPRGLFSKQVEFTVQFRRYTHEYREDTLLQRITTFVTDVDNTELIDTIEVSE